jgi:hypothetical protein
VVDSQAILTYTGDDLGKEKAMQERRRSKRRNMSYYMPVLDPRSEEILGHLVDITHQGIMMDSKKVFPLNKDFKLRLNVTADVADKSSIDFIARSKWCKPDTIEPYLYDIGFEIIKISNEDAGVVKRIVEKYGSQDSSAFG